MLPGTKYAPNIRAERLPPTPIPIPHPAPPSAMPRKNQQTFCYGAGPAATPQTGCWNETENNKKKVEIIASETIEYDAEELSQMPLRQLRALMLQTGIEVDGCLEKADLLERIMSSRLINITHGAPQASSGDGSSSGSGSGSGGSGGGGSSGSGSGGGREGQASAGTGTGTETGRVYGQSATEERRESPSMRESGGSGGGDGTSSVVAGGME